MLDSNLLDPDTVSPETADDFLSLDPRYIRVEQIGGLIFAVVVIDGTADRAADSLVEHRAPTGFGSRP